MVAKAARVKKIPFTYEVTDPPGKQSFLIKDISNLGSGLPNIQHLQKIQSANYGI